MKRSALTATSEAAGWSEPVEVVQRRYSLARSLYRMQEMAKKRASRREARRREVLLDPTLAGEYR